MKWSRELRIARRSMRTAIRAATAMAAARAKLPVSLRPAPWSTPGSPRPGLVEVADFGSNPGRLTMLAHLPTDPPMPEQPLIVLLHGCGQPAAGFAHDTGWADLADRLGIPWCCPSSRTRTIVGDASTGSCQRTPAAD